MRHGKRRKASATMPRWQRRRPVRGPLPRPRGQSWPKPCRPNQGLPKRCARQATERRHVPPKQSSGRNGAAAPKPASPKYSHALPRQRQSRSGWRHVRMKSPPSAMSLPTALRRPKHHASRRPTHSLSPRPRSPRQKRRSARRMPRLPTAASSRSVPRARASVPRRQDGWSSSRSATSSAARRTAWRRLPRRRMPPRFPRSMVWRTGSSG